MSANSALAPETQRASVDRAVGRFAAVDRTVARFAGPQHGVVTRGQLTDAGLSDDGIRHRAKVGHLHRLHRGVYAVGHVPPSPLAPAIAAVFACGPGGVLSHSSAATLWGISPRWRSPIEVIAPTVRRPQGVWVHRSCQLLPVYDTTVHFGIPVTTPARTLLDLASRLDDDALARAINDARLSGHLRLPQLADMLARFPRRPGTPRLRSLLDDGRGPTRSAFEDAFIAFAQRHGLPRPEVNCVVAGHEVDALFRDHDLAVELDGYRYHDGRRAFERDRDRDADLLAAGIATVRVTWRRLASTPEREATRLRAILARQPRNPPPACLRAELGPRSVLARSIIVSPSWSAAQPQMSPSSHASSSSATWRLGTAATRTRWRS